MPLEPAGTPSRQAIQDAIDEAVAAALGDTGWIALTHAGTSGTLRYRVIAGVVHVECSINIASLADASSVDVLEAANAIPTAYRPSLALGMGIGRAGAGTQAAVVTARTNGSIGITNRSGAATTSIQFRYSYPVG